MERSAGPLSFQGRSDDRSDVRRAADSRVRFGRRRAFGAGRNARRAAAGERGLCRRFGRLSLWHAQRRRNRGANPRFARARGGTLSPAPDRHRLQHRIDDRAGRGAGGARSARGRHGAGDQARSRAQRNPRDRRARHDGRHPRGYLHRGPLGHGHAESHPRDHGPDQRPGHRWRDAAERHLWRGGQRCRQRDRQHHRHRHAGGESGR